MTTTDPTRSAEILAGFATSHISDALDNLGITGQVVGVRAFGRGLRVAGPAFTVRFVPCEPGEGPLGDYIDEVPSGSVVVLDNAGREVGSVWGGVLTQTALARGLAGTVADGICRDTASAEAAGYPLFGRNAWMRTGNGRVRAEARVATVSLGGVRVRPGDLVVGDDDGVVVVPRERVDEVLGIARKIHDVEEQIVAAVWAGRTVAEAREEVQRPGLKGARS